MTDQTHDASSDLNPHEDDIEAIRAIAHEQIANDVLGWLSERGLYDPRDYEHEGPNVAEILTDHEEELLRPRNRQSPEEILRTLTAGVLPRNSHGQHRAMGLRAAIERVVRHSAQQSDVKERIKGWKSAVEELLRDISGWLDEFVREGSVKLDREKISIHEQGAGDYDIARLDIQIGDEYIRIEPKGTFVVGAFGRVDIYLLGTGSPTCIIRKQGDDGSFRWTICDSFERVDRPLTKESFESLLETILEDF